MPDNAFAWSKLPEPLLKELARHLGVDGSDPSVALNEQYGPQPTEDFIRNARAVLDDKWLARDLVALGSIVKALWRPGQDGYKFPATRQAQLDYLKSRNTTGRLARAMADQLVASSESMIEPRLVPERSRVEDRQTLGNRQTTSQRSKRAPRNAEPASEPLGIEDVLWKAADKLRGSMDASEYKHVVLGLIFLKYIDDAFSERRTSAPRGPAGDGFAGEWRQSTAWSPATSTRREGVFWVPPEARWGYLQAQAKQPAIGKLDRQRHGPGGARQPQPPGGAAEELLPASPRPASPRRDRRPDRRHRARVAGATGEGRTRPGIRVLHRPLRLGRGQRWRRVLHASLVVRLLVEMIEPYGGRVYDPCCGSGGMFVQSENFVEAHGGRRNDISIFGQETERHHLATGQDEPRYSGHRGRPWPSMGRHLPRRPPPGPEGRLHPRQSAFQRLGLGRGAAPG